MVLKVSGLNKSSAGLYGIYSVHQLLKNSKKMKKHRPKPIRIQPSRRAKSKVGYQLLKAKTLRLI